MPSAKYSEVYQKIRDMGDKLKAAGKQGPSNDEQLKVCFTVSIPSFLFPWKNPVARERKKKKADDIYNSIALRICQGRRGQGHQRSEEAGHV